MGADMSDSGRSRDHEPPPSLFGPVADSPPAMKRAKATVSSLWIDCGRCGWRHYPQSKVGGWSVATTACSACGATLPPRPPDAGP